MTIVVTSVDTVINYDWLQDAIESWLHNSAAVAQIPTFITLAEASLNRALRLRTMETDNDLTLLSGERTVTLPDGYIEPISLELVISGQTNEPLTPKRPQQLPINISSGSNRRPRYWAINGTEIEFPNLADQNYSLSFRMLTAFALSTINQTNWLLTNHPDLYLYGSMLQAAPYMVSDARIPVWQMMYKNALQEVQNNAARSRSISALVTDLPRSGRGGYNVYTD